jgi:hypothetical protein
MAREAGRFKEEGLDVEEGQESQEGNQKKTGGVPRDTPPAVDAAYPDCADD